MSDSRLFTVEFRVSIDNFLECRAKPVVLVVVVQEGLEESWSWNHRSWLHVLRCRKSWPVLLQISLIGRPSNLQPFCKQVHQTAPGCHPVNVKTVLIEGSVVLSSSRRHHPPPQAPVPE